MKYLIIILFLFCGCVHRPPEEPKDDVYYEMLKIVCLQTQLINEYAGINNEIDKINDEIL